ncbi:MAG: heparan-alpha-glucosaminide N-acetyltransferase domain-containing protein [Acidobacteriota bacterium]|nr:heparan-alpha-glucosaminide N-acetyltransferase domain-containing protein [Acidobacteriota bacterium]
MRKRYLDWLRGVAVIVMVLAHVSDAWTIDADRTRTLYAIVIFIAGLAAPLFLFLAGLTLSMAAVAKAATIGHSAAGAAARIRGGQILALAFIFRLQSQLLGWGAWINFLKVDILNVMGVSMIVAGCLWSISASRAVRIAAFAIATTAITMVTPIIRELPWLAPLPDAIEAYIRPIAGRTTFTIFPWSGFLFAGVIAGELVAAARTEAAELRLHGWLLAAGVAGITLGYWASFQPSIYPVANFWTSSPTFFFIKLGIATLLLPIARAIDLFHQLVLKWQGWEPGTVITTLGRASLFVYWIHVEMVYGVLGRPLRRLLPLEASITATAVLCLILYGIVLWRDRAIKGRELPRALRILTPILK